MTENKKENLNNRMIKFLFEGAPVRGACVQMAEEWQELIKFHHYPENVAALLGQFTAGALLLSSTIKFEGSLILQVKGSGPIAFIYAEVRNPMSVRAMAEIREGAEIKPEMDLQELINKDGKGLCALILDPKNRRPGVQPYQGMVSLESNSVAENLENYMAKSEQLETKLYLAADSKKLGGFVIQKMPSVGGNVSEISDPDAWGRILQLAHTVTKDELLNVPATDVLHRLFWQEKLVPVAETDITFECNCSRDKTDSMLLQLGKQECMDILKAEGKIEVNCRFCNRKQVYTPEEVEALFVEPNIDAAAMGTDPKRPQ